MRRGLIALVVVLAWAGLAHAATLTVGSGKTYATIQACANSAVAGDTCLVDAGTYDEAVQTMAAGTSEQTRIVFKASGAVTLKAFRIRHDYITVDGFTFAGYVTTATQLWAAAIRIESGADNSEVINNTITDGVYLTSSSFVFDSGDRTVTNAAGGFTAAGFVAGMYVYIGSDINAQIDNHDNDSTCGDPDLYAQENKIVESVTDTTLTFVSGTTVCDEGPVQATIYAQGVEKDGIGALVMIPSGGVGASHARIAYNTISDTAGKVFVLYGDYNTVEYNTVSNTHGWQMLGWIGSHNTFRYNVWKDAPRWDGFSAPTEETVHAEGVGTWDMYAQLFYSLVTAVSSENIYEYNWVEDVDQQFTNMDDTASSTGFILRRNVFINYEMSGAMHRPNTWVTNNTFYLCAPESAIAFSLAHGYEKGDPQGSLIQNNVFLACNDAASATEGWYSTYDDARLHDPAVAQLSDGVAADYNYVAGSAAGGYQAKTGFQITANGVTLETHGINGGNPLLIDESNPLGPDTLPFTLDDGLRPSANSPLCEAGALGADIGAYDCQPSATIKLVCATPAICAYQSIQACANAATAGQTCLVSAGTYDEYITTVRDGSSGSRITFKASGDGVVVKGFQIDHAYITVDGFEITGAPGDYAALLIMPTGDNAEVLNNDIHDIVSAGGIWVYLSGGLCADGATIRGNSLSYIATLTNNYGWVQTCGIGVVVENNTFSHLDVGWGQDFLRVWGDGVTIRRNTFIGGTATANHPDIIQTLGIAGVPAKNVLIEENMMYDLNGGIAFCQLEAGLSDGTVNAEMHHWTWRRNVVVGIYGAASAGHIPYSTFDHNTFYRLAYAGSGLAMGGSLWRGNSDHATFTNNAWIDVGSAGTTTTGWYPNGLGMVAALNDETLNGIVTANDQTATDAIQADLVTNGYMGANGNPLAPAYTLYASYVPASPDASGMTFTVAEGYQSYKLDTYVALMETVEMDTLMRTTFIATNNYAAGSVVGGYTAKRADGGCADGVLTSERFCEVVLSLGGVNGGDPGFTSMVNILGQDGAAFTIDDGPKPGVSSILCAKASDGTTAIGAYSCEAAKVWSGSVQPPSNVIVKEP